MRAIVLTVAIVLSPAVVASKAEASQSRMCQPCSTVKGKFMLPWCKRPVVCVKLSEVKVKP